VGLKVGFDPSGLERAWGTFPAFEQPQLWIDDLRAFLRAVPYAMFLLDFRLTAI
jgi:hypothetical protein